MNTVQQYIKYLYNNLLYREPNQFELDYNINLINNKKKNINQIKLIIFNSKEYINKNYYINNLSINLNKLSYSLNFLESKEKKITCRCRINEMNNLTKKSWNNIWFILHKLSYLISNNFELNKLKNIIINLILPCKICQDHFILYKKNCPIPNNKNEIIDWLINLHNDINSKNNKKTFLRKEIDLMYN